MTPEDAKAAYWRLDNHVVVQGQLFEVAPFVVTILVMSLVEERPRHVRIAVLELLFQILSREAHVDEVERGNGMLTLTCRDRAREGLWLLYVELLGGEHEAARNVIELIDSDTDRFLAFLSANRPT